MDNDEDEGSITWGYGDYKVKMTEELDKKLKFLSNKYSHEIAGWLVGEKSDKGYEINGILIPEQEVTGGTVDIEAAAGAALVKQFGVECQKIIGHWHSHCKMGVFWSATDETAMTELSEPRDGYLFIVSSNNKHKCRVYIDHSLEIKLDDMPIEIECADEGFDELKKIISDNVTQKTYSYGNRKEYQSYNGYNKFNKTPSRSLSEEMFMGVTISYKEKILTVCGLVEDEGRKLMAEYKACEPKLDTMDHLCDFTMRVKKYDKALEIIENIKDCLIDSAAEYMGDLDDSTIQRIKGME